MATTFILKKHDMGPDPAKNTPTQPPPPYDDDSRTLRCNTSAFVGQHDEEEVPGMSMSQEYWYSYLLTHCFLCRTLLTALPLPCFPVITPQFTILPSKHDGVNAAAVMLNPPALNGRSSNRLTVCSCRHSPSYIFSLMRPLSSFKALHKPSQMFALMSIDVLGASARLVLPTPTHSVLIPTTGSVDHQVFAYHPQPCRPIPVRHRYGMRTGQEFFPGHSQVVSRSVERRRSGLIIWIT